MNANPITESVDLCGNMWYYLSIVYDTNTINGGNTYVYGGKTKRNR